MSKGSRDRSAQSALKRHGEWTVSSSPKLNKIKILFNLGEGNFAASPEIAYFDTVSAANLLV